MLDRAGHKTNKKIIDNLTKYCTHCQKNGKSPSRFKFALNEDVNFNYSILVDIMYIDGDPILHFVDEATRFQAARCLNNMFAKHIWDTLRLYWIEVYIGPPDLITHDTGSNFVSKEFRPYATSMGITTRSVPVEANCSIKVVGSLTQEGSNILRNTLLTFCASPASNQRLNVSLTASASRRAK